MILPRPEMTGRRCQSMSPKKVGQVIHSGDDARETLTRGLQSTDSQMELVKPGFVTVKTRCP